MVKHVRSAEGVNFFHLPIGTPISAAMARLLPKGHGVSTGSASGAAKNLTSNGDGSFNHEDGSKAASNVFGNAAHPIHYTGSAKQAADESDAFSSWKNTVGRAPLDTSGLPRPKEKTEADIQAARAKSKSPVADRPKEKTEADIQAARAKSSAGAGPKEDTSLDGKPKSEVAAKPAAKAAAPGKHYASAKDVKEGEYLDPKHSQQDLAEFGIGSKLEVSYPKGNGAVYTYEKVQNGKWQRSGEDADGPEADKFLYISTHDSENVKVLKKTDTPYTNPFKVGQVLKDSYDLEDLPTGTTITQKDDSSGETRKYSKLDHGWQDESGKAIAPMFVGGYKRTVTIDSTPGGGAAKKVEADRLAKIAKMDKGNYHRSR